MIYHISRGAPKSTKPKIKETLRFYKRFRANVRGTGGASTDGGGKGGERGGRCSGLKFSNVSWPPAALSLRFPIMRAPHNMKSEDIRSTCA